MGRTNTPYVSLVLNVLDRRQDLLLLRTDALLLWKQGKLQKCGPSQFCPPRNWRQIFRDETPAPHPDVLALAAKAGNRQRGKQNPDLFNKEERNKEQR